MLLWESVPGVSRLLLIFERTRPLCSSPFLNQCVSGFATLLTRDAVVRLLRAFHLISSQIEICPPGDLLGTNEHSGEDKQYQNTATGRISIFLFCIY